MNYPFWIVPTLGSAWVIGIIAIVHVYVSHFAVGGGAFLAVTEHLAYRRQDEQIYDYVKRHSRFFVLLTTVFGAITGVGIWWAISLANPDATATLIQNFTFAWALEYVFFVAELATAFAYYYTWDKISRQQHLLLAKLYFFLSVFTLFIINGILSFMLTPGHWLESHYWLAGFFNPTYLSSSLVRLLVMFAIAGLYALVTSARLKDSAVRNEMLRFSARWLWPIIFAGPPAMLWFLYSIPQSTLGHIPHGFALTGPGNFNIVAPAFYACLILSGVIAIATFVGPYLNPRRFTFWQALVLLILGLAVTGTGEWIRELLRKPYVVYDYMYSNGIRKDSVNQINIAGFLPSSVWARASSASSADEIATGEVIFRYQCMSCHTIDGYRSIAKLVAGRDQSAILAFLNMLSQTDKSKNTYYSGFMPPVVGSTQEIEALSKYLYSINHVSYASGGQPEDAEKQAVDKTQSLHGPAAGQKVFESAGCQFCHAGGLNSINPQKPIKGELFAKKYPADASLIKVIREGIKGTAMPANNETKIDDAEMKNLIAYIRSLTPAGK